MPLRPPRFAAAGSSLPLLSHLLDLTAQTRSLRATASLHAHLLRAGLYANAVLHPKLFLSYAAATAGHPSDRVVHGLLVPLSQNGDDPPLWNVVISVLSRKGLAFLSLRTFTLARRVGLVADSYALCTALTASVGARDLSFARQVHGHACKSGWVWSVFVGGALIDVYAKFGAVGDACGMFDEMLLKNAVCVNALMAGYADSRLWDEGLCLVRRMPDLGLVPDGFTLSTILRMCAEVSAVGLGMQAHAHLVRRVRALEDDVFVQSSLVEMYGKCGVVQKARLVFDMTGSASGRRRDVVLWTSMLNAYSRNGQFENVITTFEEMLSEGIRPDEIALVAVLSACSRMGQFVRGLQYFDSMTRDYGLIPWAEHYGCIMDLLCKAGQLEKAWNFANGKVSNKSIDIGLSISVWGALLRACRDCGNVEMGRAAAQRALELDPKSAGIYVELSNLYAMVGKWDEFEKLRKLIMGVGLKKDAGSSWLESTSSY